MCPDESKTGVNTEAVVLLNAVSISAAIEWEDCQYIENNLMCLVIIVTKLKFSKDGYLSVISTLSSQ